MKQRGARMSKMQQEVYIKFLEHNPNFSTGTNSISYDLSTRERDFDRLVDQLNGTPGAVKDRKHWQETLADWRSKLLKRYRYHYSEEVRNSMSESAVRNLKKFDEFDVRALKALGKWENDHGGASKVLNNRKRKRRRVYRRGGGGGDDESESDEQDEQDEDDSEDNDFYSLMSPAPESFNCLNVKTEVEIEDPLVEEIQAPIINSHDEPMESTPQMSRRKRRNEVRMHEIESEQLHVEHDGHYEQNDQNLALSYEKVLLENTKAMKQHTAAIMGLTDALNSLTSTIRSYMYNK